MPNETQQAVDWALTQTYVDYRGMDVSITADNAEELVGAVREYFNTNQIEYTTFSYYDLQPYF